MKTLKNLSENEVKELHEIKGGDDSIITDYVDTGISDGIGTKTTYVDPNGAPRTDRKILGIVIKINPGS